MNLFDLTNKVAIVTGASSGIGRDAAKAYAEYGASVALLARRQDRLESLAEEIQANTGKKAIAICCDVTDEKQVRKAVTTVIQNFGKIDILLNNAGTMRLGTVEELTMDDWQISMNTNVTGMYLMCKYVIPHMREEQYGKIVNISSVNAITSGKGMFAVRHSYNVSKGAVRSLTLAMATTYMEDNITVNSVGPGLFETEMTELLFEYEGFMKKFNCTCPASRPARKGELNGAVIFLSSDASSYITAQHILVDGGISVYTV